MLIDILGYTFLGIFVLTAILTLASLPGWVPIAENYRKVLFKALILEVVGAILVLFTNNYLQEKSNLQATINPNPNEWIIIDEGGSVVRPTLQLTNPDTSFSLGSDEAIMKKRLENLTFTGELSPLGFALKNTTDQPVGKVPLSSLEGAGLFNTIDSHQGEIAGSSNYSLVKFNKNDEGQWIRSGAFLDGSPFSVRVFDLGTKTIYEIRDTEKEEVLFSSSRSSEPLFNVDNRKLHFYPYLSNFFLFRITEADLSGDKKFVHFLQIKFKPTLEVN